jgi:hypothetical protein
MGSARAMQRAAAASAISMILVACSAGADNPRAGDGREAAVYESVLAWMLDEEPQRSSDERTGWTMYVESRYEEPIAVGVQALVVEALDDRVVVRFIDERAEAVEEDDEWQPVRDNGILVGLGGVPPEGDTVNVYVDRYRDIDDVDAFDIAVRRRGDTWEVVGVPAVADPRVLPPGD